MRAARQSQLGQPVLDILDKAPRYPEGTGVRLEVKTQNDLEPVRKLAEIKLLQLTSAGKFRRRALTFLDDRRGAGSHGCSKPAARVDVHYRDLDEL